MFVFGHIQWSYGFVTDMSLFVQVMHLDWSSGQSCQPDNEPWLWQGCKPYHNLNSANSANLDNESPLWPTLANNKLQLKETMQFNGSFRTSHFQDSYPPSSHWQGNDDRTLSPYMNDHHYQYGMPAALSAPSTELHPTSSKGLNQVTALTSVCSC